MEEKFASVAVPPPLPPKTKPRTPLQHSGHQQQHSTVPTGTVAPASVSFVDVFHDSNSSSRENHVVKILINPDGGVTKTESPMSEKVQSADRQSDVIYEVAPCIRISLNSESEMIHKSMEKPQDLSGSYFYFGSYNFGVMSSGQVSPSDTLDSGTCSDLDGTPTPPAKKNGVSVTLIGKFGKFLHLIIPFSYVEFSIFAAF